MLSDFSTIYILLGILELVAKMNCVNVQVKLCHFV
jgi:hypothetical protein